MPSELGDVIGNDRIVSLWFADHSAVVETNILQLQWLVDILSLLLSLIGLITKLTITLKQGGRPPKPRPPVYMFNYLCIGEECNCQEHRSKLFASFFKLKTTTTTTTTVTVTVFKIINNCY